MILADLDLARRLEHTEGRTNAAFVDSRAKLDPGSGATWSEFAGAFAMFDGTDSPLTQTFGLGTASPITGDQMEAIESFFESRGAAVCHEISPMAGNEALTTLGDRGYAPIELTSVMYQPLRDRRANDPAVNPAIRVRNVPRSEADHWSDVATRGWIPEAPELEGFLREIGRINAGCPNFEMFLAELGGEFIAAGGLSIIDGVALLAGASTVPEARHQGAQRALLDSRLRYAGERGCELAMMGAAPGSASQRNAQRNGFLIAYTRIKWRLATSDRR